MTLNPLELPRDVVLDGHYGLRYQQGAPEFLVEHIDETDIILSKLNLALPSSKKSGQHYSIKHSHHLQTNLYIEELEDLKKMVLWYIEFYRAVLIAYKTIPFALKIISNHIAEDQMFLEKIKKTVKELNSHRPVKSQL